MGRRACGPEDPWPGWRPRWSRGSTRSRTNQTRWSSGSQFRRSGGSSSCCLVGHGRYCFVVMFPVDHWHFKSSIPCREHWIELQGVAPAMRRAGEGSRIRPTTTTTHDHDHDHRGEAVRHVPLLVHHVPVTCLDCGASTPGVHPTDLFGGRGGGRERRLVMPPRPVLLPEVPGRVDSKRRRALHESGDGAMAARPRRER